MINCIELRNDIEYKKDLGVLQLDDRKCKRLKFYGHLTKGE